jgi:hypothetical protein
LALATITAVAAAHVPTFAAAQSERLIPLVDGRTCWTPTSNRCFRYDESRRTATRSGFGNVRVSSRIEVKPGFITESGFVAIERAISKQTGGHIYGR